MIQQIDSSLEGSIWFLIIISVLAAIGISVLKYFISGVVEFFVVKKRENEDEVKKEVSKISVLIFVLIAAFLLLWQSETIADTFNRPVEELQFAGLMLILVVILIAGVVYREPSKNLRKRISRRKT